VLCYLVMFKGLTYVITPPPTNAYAQQHSALRRPLQADLYTRQFRPHISKKYDEEDVVRCHEIGMRNKNETTGLRSRSGVPYSAAAIAALAREVVEGRVVEPTRTHLQADKQDNVPAVMRQGKQKD
jgi:hypothetical protein